MQNSVFAANPLVAAVLRENVRLSGERALIDLWPHWASLLAEVHAFGRVLSVSRNDHAVLGRLGAYSPVLCAPCGHCGGSPDGSMEFYFERWQKAFVSVEQQPGGWLYAVEFLDACGDTLHKICLTPESDFGAVLVWVEQNQATAGSADGMASRRLSCAEQNAGGADDAIALRPQVVREILAGMIEEEICAQFVVGNEGMVQGADMRPRSLRENGHWIFLSGDDCGVHLRLERIAEVRLLHVQWPDGGHWAVKVYEPEGRLVCVLAPPREGSGGDWDQFLLETTAAHHIDNTLQ